MNDAVKTVVLLVAAAVVSVAAFVLQPRSFTFEREEIGERIFPEFKDATVAAALEIVRYDPGENQSTSLKIANRDGQWLLASHKDYPADAGDAAKRIHEAAINLMGLEVLAIASDIAADHEQYGVLDPSEENRGALETSIGMLVRLQDAADKKLAELIIGLPNRADPSQRFVRRPKQNRVYVVKVDPNTLSTKFEDWIEGDLLKLSESDIRLVTLKDYTIQEQLQLGPRGVEVVARPDERLELSVKWDADNWKWQLDSLKQNIGRGLEASQLLDSEELNRTKLDDMKSALDDLKIVDVYSKPEGLTAELKADEAFLRDIEQVRSLNEKGFFPGRRGDQIEIMSSEGEVRVGTKDGVEYLLRFGNSAGIEQAEGETKLKRYLLVSARANNALIPEPEYEKLPEPMPAETPVPSTSNNPDESKQDGADDSKSDGEKTPADTDKSGGVDSDTPNG